MYESRTYKFKLAYIIVLIFGINHGLMMLDDTFKLIQGDMDVSLKGA